MQKDNSTFERKRSLRLATLQRISDPVVMETHGGMGKLFASCYSTRPQGIVFEKSPAKADHLASQRPSWAVYCCNVVPALRAGVGAHLPVNFLDLDPYGSPWETVDAFFRSSRPFPEVMGIVANDGLRQKVQLSGAWTVKALEGVVRKYGNNKIYGMYKELCRELLAEYVSAAGYRVASWAAYYTGEKGAMTHWNGILKRNSDAG